MVTLHQYGCRHFRSAATERRQGPYRSIEEARLAGWYRQDKPCIYIAACCRAALPDPYRDWRCLCQPDL